MKRTLIKSSIELIKSLVENYSPKKKLFSIFGKTTKSNSFNNGFYVWGDVGRGKNDYKELFKVTLTISIGFGNTPFEANLKAYDGKQNNIILNQEHNIFGFIDSTVGYKLESLDIDDLKSKRKDNSPYEISLKIFDLRRNFQKYFIEKNSLTFFIGGDNYMIVE